jgi:hypothetical protein
MASTTAPDLHPVMHLLTALDDHVKSKGYANVTNAAINSFFQRGRRCMWESFTEDYKGEVKVSFRAVIAKLESGLKTVCTHNKARGLCRMCEGENARVRSTIRTRLGICPSLNLRSFDDPPGPHGSTTAFAEVPSPFPCTLQEFADWFQEKYQGCVASDEEVDEDTESDEGAQESYPDDPSLFGEDDGLDVVPSLGSTALQGGAVMASYREAVTTPGSAPGGATALNDLALALPEVSPAGSRRKMSAPKRSTLKSASNSGALSLPAPQFATESGEEVLAEGVSKLTAPTTTQGRLSLEALKIGIMEMLPPTKKPEPLKVAFAQYTDDTLNEMADYYRLSPVCRTSRARLIQALAVRWSTESKAESWRMCESLFILSMPPWLVDTDMVRGLLKQVHPELNKLLVEAQSKIEAEAKGKQHNDPSFAYILREIDAGETYTGAQVLGWSGASMQVLQQEVNKLHSSASKSASVAAQAAELAALAAEESKRAMASADELSLLLRSMHGEGFVLQARK